MAAEVLCLASSSEGGAGLLASVVESGGIQLLLRSADPNTRAAAASALAKLSIKAKALRRDSPEVSQMMNVVLDVLKAAAKLTATAAAAAAIPLPSVSFSSFDKPWSTTQTATKALSPSDARQQQQQQQSLTAVERAVEVVAAMVGQSHIKEELVHGSYRVAASVEHLLALELDASSTAAYGVAHILAALTVTNAELRSRALADKGITPEQFEQLQRELLTPLSSRNQHHHHHHHHHHHYQQHHHHHHHRHYHHHHHHHHHHHDVVFVAELQRLKTKDDNGNEVQEPAEPADPDTDVLCRRRIRRIAAAGGILTLVK